MFGVAEAAAAAAIHLYSRVNQAIIIVYVYAHVVQFVPINRRIAPPDRALYSGSVSLIPLIPLSLCRCPHGAHPGSSSVGILYKRIPSIHLSIPEHMRILSNLYCL